MWYFRKLILKKLRPKAAFALPTLVITATILMVTAVSMAQTTVSIAASIRSQDFKRIADEAVKAGEAYAYSCLQKNKTNYWQKDLKPNTNCNGIEQGGASEHISSNNSWSSTFAVAEPDTTGDYPKAAVTGKVTLAGSNKTYVAKGMVIMNVQAPLTVVGQETGRDTPLGDGYNYYLNSMSSQTNGSNVCGVASDGQAYCAGSNNYGQLGDGTTTNRSTPVKFNLPTGLSAKSVVSFGTSKTCVLASSNEVYCAGNNSSGDLGDGTTTNRSTPVKFKLPTGLSAYRLISSSDYSYDTCVITSPKYELYCAGNNSSGELGDGTTTNRSTPVKFGSSSTSGFLSIMPMIDAHVGSGSICAIGVLVGAARGMYCAGGNAYGSLGDGSSFNSKSTPVSFAFPSGQQALSITSGSGNYENCALTSLNNLYCAGWNSSGEFGDGTTTQRNTPVKFNVPGSDAVKVSSNSGDHTCVVTYNGGNVYCAGSNLYGQLGDGTTTQRNTPVKFNLPAGKSALSVMTGGGYNGTTCVLTADYNLYCSGKNDYGQLGDGTTTNRSTPVRFGVAASAKVTNFIVSGRSICALASGQIYCAGQNTNGRFGDGTTTNRSTPVKFQLP